MSKTHLVVRVERELYETLKTVAKNRGQQLSSFVREIIKTQLAQLSYLTPSEKKALGVLVRTMPNGPQGEVEPAGTSYQLLTRNKRTP
jgi:metal-responsive CopG/Arc/MetJ family transcriptional regulator